MAVWNFRIIFPIRNAKNIAGTGIKKGELPRLTCFHNGIILIVISFKIVTAKIYNLK